jgi:hypothetical protein
MMITQLELFAERLPEKPYCAEKLGFTFIRAKASAMRRPYIQPNSPNETHCLVFDVDRPAAAIDWEDLQCPPPSIITRNPENGHAHLVYLLAVPVHHNHTSRKNPIRYLAAVEAALRDKLVADPAYSGLLTKNPIHPRWEVLLRQANPYDLAWLADWLDLSAYSDKRRNLPNVGLGRNCTTFDRVRKWAYSEIRKPQGWFGYDFWFAVVLAKAMAVNAGFAEPLTSVEVRGIAKSIAKWVWENMSPEGFQAWSQNRRIQSLRVRQSKSEELKAAILEARRGNPSASQRQLAALVGCSQRTVSNVLSNL